MHLSESGCIAKKCWLEIADHFPFVKLSEFVIMPNHVHGIISIIKNPVNDDPRIDIDYPHNAETRHALSLPVQPPVPIQPPIPVQPPVPVKLSSPGQKRFQNQGKNTVSSIIGGYKSATTRNIRKMNFEFQWQGRFWDHVIREDNEFEPIRKYIIENPAKWTDDDFFW